MSGEVNQYNPVRDEPERTIYFACLWELLRRNPHFQTDVKLWVDSWNECEQLLAAREKMSVRQCQGQRGQSIHERLVQLTDQLFALAHGTLPFIEWEAVPLDEMKRPSNIVLPGKRQLTAVRAWPRAEYVVCALEWMLPPLQKTESA